MSDAGSGRSAPRRALPRSLGWFGVELVALTGFAVAQPIYDLVSNNPTFLVAHRVDGLEVVWYAAVLLLVPPAVLLAFEALVGLVHPPVLRPVHTGLVGVLAGLAVTPPLARALGSGPVLWLALFAVIAGGAAFVYWTRSMAGSVLRVAALAAPVFLVLFLLSPGVRGLLDPSDAGAVAEASANGTSVLWIVLDELPLGVLLDENGDLDREHFPGFASLADVSTWYPSAVASSPRTNVSLLSTLTGAHPDNTRVLPVGSQHPVNAFSLFGGGHEMQVRETITQICPASLCPDQDGSGTDEVLWSDTWTIYVRSVSPDTVADRLVPETGDRWAGFGDSGVDEEVAAEQDTGEGAAAGAEAGDASAGVDEVENMDELFERVNELARTDLRLFMDAVVESVVPTDQPVFTFVHALLPHIPYRYLPGGLAYDRGGSYGSIDGIFWVEDEAAVDHMMQRMVLQTQYVDEQIGRLVERLQSTGRLDDTIVVVMSDHGVSMTPDTRRREYEPATVDDMLTIPLFVHYPGQTEGEVDGRPAQPVDVLPTLLEVAGIEPPPSHTFDGDSLLGPPDGTAELTQPDGVVSLDPLPDVLAGDVLARKSEMFPPGSDGYRPSPNGHLVGEPLPEDAPAAEDLVADLGDMERYAEVDPDSGIVPAHVVGSITGRDEGVDLGIGIGDAVAGVGRSYRTEDGWQIAVMVDPSLLAAGPNEVTVWEITSDGLRSIELEW